MTAEWSEDEEVQKAFYDKLRNLVDQLGEILEPHSRTMRVAAVGTIMARVAETVTTSPPSEIIAAMAEAALDCVNDDVWATNRNTEARLKGGTRPLRN